MSKHLKLIPLALVWILNLPLFQSVRRPWVWLALCSLAVVLPVRAQSTVEADGTTDTYTLIESVLGSGTASETPDCSHPAFGPHITQNWDDALGKYIFSFFIHVTPDDDRCIIFDRQRNEIKTFSGSPAYLKGFYGDTCAFRWYFKLDAGFQPSPNFCHIHQIKAGDGTDADSPIITITPRYASPDQLQIIFVAPTAFGGAQSTLTTANLSNFKGQWIEAYERVSYATSGTYELVLKRVSDRVTLLSYTNNNLNLWRGDATFNRPKWGIYRSTTNVTSYLRDEEVRFADFCLTKGGDTFPTVGPSLKLSPTNRTVVEGQSATFTAVAGGTAPLIYRWRFNTTNQLAWGTNASLTFAAVQPQNAGSYTVVVTNAYGVVTSAVATLTVLPATPPAITQPPHSIVITNGNSTNFSVTVTGSTPLTYRWRKGGVTVAGGTNAVLSFASVGTNDAGDYDVVVTNVVGSVTSIVATLTVFQAAAPVITQQPQSVSLTSGESATFSVTTTGSDPRWYRWRRLGVGWGSGNDWRLTNGGGTVLVGDSTLNGTATAYGINTGGKSWGLSNNVAPVTEVVRSFSALSSGETFQIDLDNGTVATSRYIGFALRNASSQSLVEFSVTNVGNYYLNGISTGIPRTYRGLRIRLTLTTATTFSAMIQDVNTGTNYNNNLPFTGSLLSPADKNITQLRVYDYRAGTGLAAMLFFNSIAVGDRLWDDASAYTTASWTNRSNLGQRGLVDGGNLSGAATRTLTFNPVTVSDSGNYDVVVANVAGTVTSTQVTLTVNKGTPVIRTVPTASAIAYGQTLTSSTLSSGAATNAAGATVSGTFAFTTPATAPGAGTALQSVTFTPVDTANYNSVTTSVSVTVSRLPVTIGAGITADNKIYDGSTTATIRSNSVVLNGILSADMNNVNLSTNGYLASFASAGTNSNIPVTVSGLTLTGSAAANYTLIQPTGLTANITAAAVVPVTTTNVLLDDFWIDGTRTDTALPTDSAWYGSSASSLVAVTNSLIGTPDPGTGGTLNWWTYFTTNPASPVQLGVSDMLRVTLAFTPYGVNASNSSRGLRLGLFDASAGTRTVADGAAPNGVNHTGYLLEMNFGQTFGGTTMKFYERTNLSSATLINTTAATYAELSSGGPAAGSVGFSDGMPYTLQLLVKRNAGSLDLSATFSATNGGWSSIVFNGTDTNNFPSAFDAFVFRAATNGLTATNFTFTELKVELVATNNQPPVAGNHTVTTTKNKSLALPVTDLLVADSDPDGDPLTITGVSALSTNGGTVALADGLITYTPPAGVTGTDRFSYTLTDSRGAAATGFVHVTIFPAPKVISLALTNGVFQVQYTGAPAASYWVQSKTNLSDSLWQTIATNATDGNGSAVFVDPDCTNFPVRVFRLATP